MRKVLLKLLTLLGVGGVTFVVTACYGPVPQGYQEIDISDEVVGTDSLDVTPGPIPEADE